MVLICNNNILTIDQFHKNRCEEKKAIRDIILNRKEIRDTYEETPPKKVEPNTTYISSTNGIEIKQTKSIYFTKPNSTRK